MFIRATIVVLLVLNLGVAAWWLLHAEPAAGVPAQPATAPRLQLVAEASADRLATAADAQPSPGNMAAQVAAPAAIEPVADAPAAVVPAAVVPAAVAATPATTAPAVTAPAVTAPAVTAQAADAGVTSQCAGANEGSRGWRVFVARLPGTDAAQAMAARIKAAGFSDYLVMRDGDDANSIALGLYSTRDAAQRRAAALQAAGFPVRCVRIPAATPA
ncbi:MAG: SPOR domain-containing protein [Luteimonas sp.]